MRQIETSISIAAPIDTVWKVLTDLPDYENWNPFITSASGAVTAGERLTVHIQPAGQSGNTFRPHVIAADPPHTFVWLGRLLMPGIFDGRHSFELSQEGDSTRLVQSEQFKGLLVPLIWKSMVGPTTDGFVRMNEALKAKCEEASR